MVAPSALVTFIFWCLNKKICAIINKMTLIISQIIDGNMFVESDSKVTDPEGALSDRFCSVLKTVILHPNICLSYAGRIDYAEKAVGECIEFIKNNKPFNILQILKILVDINLESEDKTHFIMGTFSKDDIIHMKITDGKVFKKSSGLLWMGTPEGYSLFEKEYKSLIKLGKSELKSLRDAFQRVIKSGIDETIGHFQISVNIDKKAFPQQPIFLYIDKINLEIPEKQTIHFEKANEWKPISLGTRKGGATGASYFRSISPYLQGVAVHFVYEKCGVLFCPQIGFTENQFKKVQGKVFKNVGGKEFLELIKKKYNLPMIGLARISDTSLQLISTGDA